MINKEAFHIISHTMTCCITYNNASTYLLFFIIFPKENHLMAVYHVSDKNVRILRILVIIKMV